MASWKPFVELKTSSGKRIERGNVTITPQAQALTVRFPYGGFVWNRPVAVIVEQDGRQQERITIVDVTRVAVLAMAGAAAVMTLGSVAAVIAGRRSRNS